MKLILSREYKSLKPFQAQLPDFTVLTGINGAGKTQILKAISDNAITLDGNIYMNKIKYISNSLLSPTDSVVLTKDALHTNAQQLWNNFHNFKSQLQQNSQLDIASYVGLEIGNVIKKIAQESKKHIGELELNDFWEYTPIGNGIYNSENFYNTFSFLFKKYHNKYQDNKFKKFLKQSEGIAQSEYLTDEEFIQKWGEAPWDFINRLNAETNLKYIVNSPTSGDKDAPFQFKVFHTESKLDVNFNELSSGEKAIMSLALALYNSSLETQFPKVLLMDEPDASLHPLMAKHFLNLLQNFFVKEKGLKVIITTHSPSTLAFAPEESIYTVNSEDSADKIEKSSKDKALSILTQGVPSFSINYENRRQVFVESPFDVLFYENIYQKLSKSLDPEVSLSFISSGDSRTDKNGQPISNCGQVVKIVSTLRSFGNKFIWGIIDFDEGNTDENHIKVLGAGERYSIENYLFDPLLVAGLLLREKFINREGLGLADDETFYDFNIFEDDKLQVISNYVTTEVSKFTDSKEDKLITVEYQNGKKVNIPNWYLQHQGHALEGVLIKAFPKLADVKRGKEELLKMAILNKVLDDVPGFIPSSFLSVFKQIQS